MNSPRWLIGLLMAFAILTITSNIVERADMLTQAQVEDIQDMTTQELISSQDPYTGGTVTSGNNPISVLQAVWKAISSDYSFWYKVDCTLTQSECTGTNTYGVTGKWNSDTDCCQVANGWSIIRYIVFWPITIAMFIEIALTIRRFFTGG